MRYFKFLIYCELICLAVLLFYSIIVGVWAYIDACITIASGTNTILGPKNTAIVVFQYTLTLGFFVVLLFGAPIYAHLSFKCLISWRWVLLLGAFPGTIISFMDTHFGLISIVSGLVVASVSHYVCLKYVEK